MKLLLVAGARPNFMKIASVIDAAREHNRRQGDGRIEWLLVHTGQHYDERMSEVFFRELGLPRPDVDLGVGSGSHAEQTAEVMRRFEPILLGERPDVLVVVGDVNSTVACSLVGVKAVYSEPAATSGRRRPLLVHVEAGLRSSDRAMPEEINRIVTDAIADVLFVTEASGERHLLGEGIPPERIELVGNTMVDTLLRHRERARKSPILGRLGLEEDGAVAPYALVTLHRPSNVDSPETLRGILAGLRVVAEELPLVFPVHPRTEKAIVRHGLSGALRRLSEDEPIERRDSRLQCLPPLGYLDFLALTASSRLVLTDSGGIQEETTVLGVPCVTLRENTERPVTVEEGTNVLAGTDPERIIACAREALEGRASARTPELWDGRAGERIIASILARLRTG